MTIEETMEALRCCIVIDCPSCPLFGAEEACKGTLVREARDTIKRLQEENSALKTELRVNLGNPYWVNICKMNARQEAKGMEKYGEPLEENTTLTTVQRIEHLQEELIDGLKYCEHLKASYKDNLTANDYQRMAMRTAGDYNTQYDMLRNAVYGLNGESGEVIDILKKHEFQGHELDYDKIMDEAGDVCWYLALLASALNVPLEEIMLRNVQKLKERYPDGFDKNRSIHRVEK
jgi:NTP pyrophosphatase (non-canonical NTP hydrolase)